MFGKDLLPLYLEEPRPGRDWWRKPCCCMYVPWAARLNQMLIVWQRDTELMLYKVTFTFSFYLIFFFFRFYCFKSMHALHTVIFQNMLEMFIAGLANQGLCMWTCIYLHWKEFLHKIYTRLLTDSILAIFHYLLAIYSTTS